MVLTWAKECLRILKITGLPKMMNLSQSSDMVTEFNIGLMELIMKDNGTLIKRRAKEHFGMLKEMFITENSKMIWQMVTENTLT